MLHKSRSIKKRHKNKEAASRARSDPVTCVLCAVFGYMVTPSQLIFGNTLKY